MKDQGQSVQSILDVLIREFPEQGSLLNYRNPFELLVAVALSAQTTDAAVNAVTPVLFRKWPDAKQLSYASIQDLETVIHSLGFFRQKAANLVASAGILTEKYGGKVPETMNELLEFPGIGRKSAHVIRAHVFGEAAIIVDTHFGRVCRRLGLTNQTDPNKVEKDIAGIVPEDSWTVFSMTANFHGRRYCHARKPQCPVCPLQKICPQIGVTATG